MPNCFNLTKIGATEPSTGIAIDEEICRHLGRPIDPIKWCLGWMDSIGFALAMGVPLVGVKDGRSLEDSFPRPVATEDQYKNNPEFFEEDLVHSNLLWKVIEFLRANYTADAWAEIGRR